VPRTPALLASCLLLTFIGAAWCAPTLMTPGPRNLPGPSKIEIGGLGLSKLRPQGLNAFGLPNPRESAVKRNPIVLLAGADKNPGVVVRLLDASGPQPPVFTRPNGGGLTSFCFGPQFGAPAGTTPPTALYYCDAKNDNHVYCSLGPGNETVLYTVGFAVRQVRLGPEGYLYFSESYGGTKNGTIYRIKRDQPLAVYRTIEIAKIGGYWNGYFGFDPQGALYVSNANTAPERIWKCPPAGAPTPIFSFNGVIAGFYFTGDDSTWYTDRSTMVRWFRPSNGAIGCAGYSPPGMQCTDVFGY
jgi:hypothetical protein